MVEQLRLSGSPTPTPPPPAKPEESAVSKDKKALRLRPIVYLILLIFIVTAGVPMLAIPSIRGRLMARVQTLRDAAAGRQKPPLLLARVGENQEPFPTEFERPAPARPQLPQIPPKSAMGGGMQIVAGTAPALPSPRKKARASEKTEASKETVTEATPAKEPASDESSEPVYKQGKIEQEAYEVVLKSNDTIAGMVVGANAALRFKTWDVAKIEEDIYYVRLIFSKQPGNTDLDYIWQVKLAAKQVTPLSYNARNLSKP